MVNASRNANLKRFEGEFPQAFIENIKLKSQFLFFIRSFLIQREFVEVQTPSVVAVSSDPVRSGGYNELFPVSWYSKKMYLRQSNQLHKQSLILSGFDKIFELGPFWRAEINPTLRHLSESLGLDIEMLNEKNLKVDDLINFIGEMLGFVTKKLFESGLIKKGDILSSVPLIFEYSEICKVLKENNVEYEYGTDFGYDIEWKLSEIIQKQHGVDFFAVIHYPNTIKKFYTKDRGELTETFDIFYRGWELSSGAIRQTDLNKLTEGMKEANLDVDKYRFYLDKFRSNRPHCGFAIGIDRFLTKLIRENNIREFVVYPRSETEIIP